MDLLPLAVNFFLIANPIGNIPAIVALVKDFPFQQQRKIVLRESIFAFLVAVGFQFAGSQLLSYLHIESYTVSIAGGLLLMLVALGMIFPPEEPKATPISKREPFLVPIATPIITGGGVMSSIMIFSSLTQNPFLVTSALVVAWCGVVPIIYSAPYLKKFLGDRGLAALEQFMGMILALLAMKLWVQGLRIFLTGS